MAKKNTDVLDKLSNTLTEFAQTKSDSINIEASQFEKLENEYHDFMLCNKGEFFIVDMLDQMVNESLPDFLTEKWKEVKHALYSNRIGLHQCS